MGRQKFVADCLQPVALIESTRTAAAITPKTIAANIALMGNAARSHHPADPEVRAQIDSAAQYGETEIRRRLPSARGAHRIYAHCCGHYTKDDCRQHRAHGKCSTIAPSRRSRSSSTNR